MKLTNLFVGLATALAVGTAMSAQAVELDRTYNKDHMTVNVSGSLAPTLTQNSSKFTYLYGDLRALDRWSTDGSAIRKGNLERLLRYENSRTTDERLRLQGFDGGWIGFDVSQNINTDIKARGSLGISTYFAGDQIFVGDLSLDYDKLGELTLNINGRLPTSSVGTSGTYNTLDRQGTSVDIRYKQIPNLRLGAYYAFADMPNAAGSVDTGIEKGYGATASYQHSFGLRNDLDMRVGYSHSQRRHDLQSNSVAQDKDAVMAGIRYNYYKTTLSVDGGVSKSDYHGNIISDAKTKTAGVRLSYEITPRLSTYGFYGARRTTSNEADGVNLNFETLYNNALYADGKQPIQETQLFKKINRDMYGVGASFNIHRNASVFADVKRETTKYSLTDGDFAKNVDDSYALGTVFYW
ncbi:hypothetical protein [Moraxella nasicaprae]|uniref:Porin domain-containing protein n=1 Tax=Moraxella nasicaprae TaxID=2904122 RepID=A0ABY6F4T6_9GAMM|nr:hypothetical protein [Moraxella nasicaprae]UXZ04997.1 hypothetical protein LU297_00650 [Moraxella nasicaprae]